MFSEIIRERPSFENPRLELEVDTLLLPLLSGDEDVETGDRFVIEELAYARESFGMLGRRALFSVRFQACAAMLVGVLGVIGCSSFCGWIWEEKGSEVRNECVGVGEPEKEVCRLFLVVVTKEARFANRLDFRGGWVVVFVETLMEDVLVCEDVMLEIDRRRIDDG